MSFQEWCSKSFADSYILQGLSQSHIPAHRGPPRMKTDVEYQIK